MRKGGATINFIQRLLRLFGGGVRVVPDGKGYRVNDVWCETQKDVRRRLEELGLSESEIIRHLRELSREKYGSPER